MQKKLALVLSLMLALSACGKDETPENSDQVENVVTSDGGAVNEKTFVQDDKWGKIAGNPELFVNEYNKLNSVQQYYFCSAFSMGAMSASKPATASAMVSYFLGLGVEKYAQGIDDTTYYAFDMGKNIFHYELVVNYILDEKICENVILDATDYVKKKKISTEEINDKGKIEAKKIVEYINKEKKKK